MEWDLFSTAKDSETIVSRQYLANLELGKFSVNMLVWL